ncbi:MAG: hypothetical protein HYT76_05280 [Deltaproteobacteria bacterium]|nr:hypothetical protein [Deltaproteobacteria bacterium]
MIRAAQLTQLGGIPLGRELRALAARTIREVEEVAGRLLTTLGAEDPLRPLLDDLNRLPPPTRLWRGRIVLLSAAVDSITDRSTDLERLATGARRLVIMSDPHEANAAYRLAAAASTAQPRWTAGPLRALSTTTTGDGHASISSGYRVSPGGAE